MLRAAMHGNGGNMRNRLYYILFVLYIIMIGFILYINGVFTGDIGSVDNLVINGLFLLIIGILFVMAAVSFGRLNSCTDALVKAEAQIYKEYEAKKDCLWEEYRSKKGMFGNAALDEAFGSYQRRMKSFMKKKRLTDSCDLEEYINEDLLDRVGASHFNGGIAGTLTGLGILGTFLGLSLGLGSFSGDDIFTISDNVGALLSGMKVAFHTSVYGIFFSLIFSFIYRSIMADAYDKLARFLIAYKQCVMPAAVTSDENSATMLIYQANMAASLKTMVELLKGNAVEQTRGVERIVGQFTEKLSQSMGDDFEILGMKLQKAAEAAQLGAQNVQSLEEAANALLSTNRLMQGALKQTLDRQEEFAGELEEQRKRLRETCDTLSDEISSQLYTFEQMREQYEK